MANGQIRISTKILTDGAKKGFATLKKEAVDSANAVKKGFSEVGEGVKALGQKATKSTKQMLSGFNEQVDILDKQGVALDNLKRQFELITSGDVMPASVKSMQVELRSAQKEAESLAKTVNDLFSKQSSMEQQLVPGSSKYQEQVKALDEVSYKIEELASKNKAARDKAERLTESIDRIKLDPKSSIEAQNLANKIKLLEQNMGKTEKKAISLKDRLLAFTKIKLSGITGSVSTFRKGFDGIGAKVDKFKSRVTKLAGAAFIFNLMRRGLSELSGSLMMLLKSNSQFSNSLNQIKANLMTAFAPIYNAILPAINALMSALATVTGTIATFVAGLFGKTTNQAKNNAAALQSQAQAYGDVGKAAKEAEGKLASFDTLEVNDAKTSDNSSGGGSDPIDFSGQVESSSWLLDILNKIKDVLGQLFNPMKEAWDAVGVQVIESLKYAFASILELLADIGRTFLEVWNSDLGISICTTILNIWVDINTFIGNVTQSTKKMWDESGRGKKMLKGFFGMFNKILSAVRSISKSLAEFALSSEFQAGIALTMDLLTKIFNTVGWIAEAFSNAWDMHGLDILTNFQSILNEILRLADSIFESIQGWVMSEEFQSAISTVLDMVGTLFGWIREIAQWIVDMYEKYLKPVLEEKVLPLINTLISIIQNIWTIAKPVIDFIVDALKVILEPAIAVVCGAFGAVIDVINFIAEVFNTVLEIIIGIFTDIEGTAQKCWDWIVGVFEGAATWFNDTLVQPVKDFFSGMWNGLKEGARNAWEGIKSVFGTVAEFFKSIFTNAWEGVKRVFSVGGKIFDGIKDGIVNAFKTIVNAIIGGINKVVAVPFNAINGAIRTVRGIDILGFKPFEWLGEIGVPQIPKLATGGVAYGPMVAQIGEYAGARNNPEIVTPENLMRQIIREETGSQKEVVIENLTIISKIGDEVLSRQVVKGVRVEEQRLGKPLFVS